MSGVVGVHGIGQQQGGRHQLVGAWQPALADGIERAVGRDGPDPALDVAYYGDLFLAADGTKGGLDGVELEDLDDDTLGFLAGIEDEIVGDEPLPARVDKGFKELPRPVARLAGWLDHRFGVAGRLLFFGDLVQVRRYQRDDDLADIVDGRMRDAIDVGTRVVIGHSLGSIVAYEYLCRTAEHGVETLITLGSPLALRSIRQALRTREGDGRPALPRVQRWVNIYDPADPVSCAGGLSPFWASVSDHNVDNGKDPHAATRYLGKRQTGDAVAVTLRA